MFPLRSLAASDCVGLHLTASKCIGPHRTASKCIGTHRTASGCTASHGTSDIVVHKLIIVLVFIPFRLHNCSSSLYSISDVILVSVFLQFLESNFSFYLVLVLGSCIILVLILKFLKLQLSEEIV